MTASAPKDNFLNPAFTISGRKSGGERSYPKIDKFLRIVKNQSRIVRNPQSKAKDLIKEMGDLTTRWNQDKDYEYPQYGPEMVKRSPKNKEPFRYALLAWPKNEEELG